MFQSADINHAACNIAGKISEEKGTILTGSMSETGLFDIGRPDKDLVQEEIKMGLETFDNSNLDLILLEVSPYKEHYLVGCWLFLSKLGVLKWLNNANKVL